MSISPPAEPVPAESKREQGSLCKATCEKSGKCWGLGSVIEGSVPDQLQMSTHTHKHRVHTLYIAIVYKYVR